MSGDRVGVTRDLPWQPDRARMAQLRAEVALETTNDGPMPVILQHVSEALLKCLELARVRIWVLEPDGTTLAMRSNAGGDPEWEQAFSGDGGATWETNWTMRFQRTGSFQPG